MYTIDLFITCPLMQSLMYIDKNFLLLASRIGQSSGFPEKYNLFTAVFFEILTTLYYRYCQFHAALNIDKIFLVKNS